MGVSPSHKLNCPSGPKSEQIVLIKHGSEPMRVLMKISFPVEAGNKAAKKDGLKVIKTILDQQEPEAAYFVGDGGKRTCMMIIDLANPSDLARIAEPWFLALNASIEVTPAMIASDLRDAMPAIEQAVKDFG